MAPAAGRGAVAVGTAAALWIEAPRPAPQHAARTIRRARWIGAVAIGVLVIPIRTPLADVAMHVAKAPVVGFLSPHGMGLAAIGKELLAVVLLIGGPKCGGIEHSLPELSAYQA